MKFIIPLPDSPYYLWQALVQMASFRELGYEEDAHYVIVYFGQPSPLLWRMYQAEELGCYIHLYPDTREDKSYSASMKPWLLGQFFEQFPDEAQSVYNYIDPDCVFTRPMDFEPFERDGLIWHGSDTHSYTGAGYIREKGEQLLLDVCEIADVPVEDVLRHDDNSIGAQYFIRDAGADFWYNVERNSVAAYKHMVATADRYKPEGHEYPIQAWCAEMYMQQFETIRAGFTPRASDLMSFCWANADRGAWSEHAYFHDAGQTVEDGVHFCKITWQSSPFGKEIGVSPDSASYEYVQLIKRTEQMFPHLIW